MVLDRNSLIQRIKEYVGDNDDDNTLSFIEDVTDSINSYDNEDWKTKYEENDASWRQKYKDRFFNAGSDKDETDDILTPPKPKTYRYEDLFTIN